MFQYILNYLYPILSGLAFPSRGIEGQNIKYSFPLLGVVVAYFLWDYSTRFKGWDKRRLSEKNPSKMSDMQVSLPGSNAVDSTMEKEITEETTLSEVTKDHGDKLTSEKTAKYKSNQTCLVEEENYRKQSEANRKVTQSVSEEISENRKVTKSSWSTSQSYEEVEEFEEVIE